MEAAEDRDGTRDRRVGIDDLWNAVEGVADALDHARHPATRHPDWRTPASLAFELGHHDHGARIRAFLHEPDDGGPPFDHSRLRHWRLSADDAARVRRRFWITRPRQRLSAREHEVLRLYVTGRTVPEVADELGVGTESVRTYLRRARAKLRALGQRATSRDDLRRALDEGGR